MAFDVRLENMLDLDHPMSKHILAASRMLDHVLQLGQEMSLAPSAVRAEQVKECQDVFAQMRELNTAQFSASTYISEAIEECENGIQNLANLKEEQIKEDRRDGEGNCPGCGEKIMKFNPMPGVKGYEDTFIALCNTCTELYMPAHLRLQSLEGFGTMAI